MLLRMVAVTVFFAISWHASAQEGRGAGVPSTNNDPAARAVAPPVPNTANVTKGVRAVMILNQSINSKSTPAGKPFTGYLAKSVTLPTGEVLPRRAIIKGHVGQVSKREKGKPNGALEIIIDSVEVKGEPDVPLVARVKALDPSGVEANRSDTLPGARLGGTSNAGGEATLAFELNDRGNLQGKYLSTSIMGVYLQPTTKGTDAAFSLGSDVYLDKDVEITLAIARKS